MTIVTGMIMYFFIIVFIIHSSFALPYNRPKLCPNATWNSIATTFANSTTIDTYPNGLFVNSNNDVYALHRTNQQVVAWLNGSSIPSKNISGGLNNPYSLFVTDAGDIYVDNGYANSRIDKWSSNSTTSIPAMYMCSACSGIFIDIANTLYCSMFSYHQVISNSQKTGFFTWTIVAGNGVPALAPNSLYNPRGIFVDTNFNLYVADSENDRIQMFAPGQLIGTALAGAGAPSTIALLYPTSVVLDADGYLFIVDSYYHRLVGSGPNGFRCIAACSGAGSTSTQLNYPLTLSFDSYGNIFVTDQYNNRIQRFLLTNNSCYNATTTTTTTAMSSVTTSMNMSQSTTTTTSSYYSNALSYNQPTFSAYTSWSGNAITFTNVSTIGVLPYGIFVDINNAVYVANRASSKVQVWSSGSTMPTRNITVGLNYPYSIFATINGDIYVDNGYTNHSVEQWSSNGTVSSSVMYVKQECYGLFIDIKYNLYCSIYNVHQVVMKSLKSNSSLWIVAAGTDCSGSSMNQLTLPRGIFVDTDLNLYVADCGNNRIQQYPAGQVTAKTVAGSTAAGTISLYCPSAVVLDGNKYLFIVDSYNHRIVGSGPTGFRCIVGCSGVAGSLSSQLIYPSSLSFDSYGNIFVTDRDNNRVQKFIVLPNTIYPVSFNQPSFCPFTTWYSDAVTFANSSTAGVQPYGVFVDINNTVYVADRESGRVQIWFAGSIYPSKTISGGLSSPLSLFATISGDIYVDNGVSYARVDKWTKDSNTSTVFMNIIEECYAVFVDISNTFYCAMTFYHQVAKKWANDNGTTLTVAAGTGAAGSTAYQLYYPAGLFVDTIFNLYVGDCGNSRVQKFPLGQSNAITIAGNGAPGTVTLSCPNAVTLDANGYLFIVDDYLGKIFGSNQFGFQCVFGCTGVLGSSANQLNYPRTFSFDSYGNLYVADQINSRIQKIFLASNSCSISNNQPRFCPDSVWYSNASTSLSSSIVGSSPYGLFIDGINNVYVPSRLSSTVLVFSQFSTIPIKNVSGGYSGPSYSLFVSMTRDIYVDSGYSSGQVIKITYNTSASIGVMNVTGSCYGLFIDINNYLYCSLKDFHQVVRILLNSGTNVPVTVAGNGSPGATSNMLNFPQGIYVDGNQNLYVADCGNDRVQRFQYGQSTGVTVAGNGTLDTILLDCPTGVVLDNDGYLFIVDSYNHRIIASSFYGFRCIVGCSGSGSTSTQLFYPQTMAFDSYGNIYVTDRNNSRIQMFKFNNSTCTLPTTIQTSTVVTTNIAETTTGNTIQTSIAETTTSITTQVNIAGTTIANTTQTYIAETTAGNTTNTHVATTPGVTDVSTATPFFSSSVPMTVLNQSTPTVLENSTIASVVDTTTAGFSEITSEPSSVTWSAETTSSTNQQSSTTTTVSTIITNETCLPPTIILIPGKSSLLSLLQYRRSQDFSIISIIQSNCQDSLSMTTEWTIKNCSVSCSSPIELSAKVITTLSELYIPSRLLDYGIYEFKLTVKLINLPNVTSSTSAYIRITASGITPNLVQLGTSFITRGYHEDLLLDPGTFSVDPDHDSFDATRWIYRYYCRIYGLYNFPNIQGTLLSIDDNRTDPVVPSCFSNRTSSQTPWEFTNSTDSPKSAVTILSGSLQPNHIYQFLLYMENRRNSSIQATGYVLVKVEDTRPQLIVVGCVISAMCLPNLEFQIVNPTTQVALFSICVGNCVNIQNIIWNVYQGSSNGSNTTLWTLFNQMSFYENIWFFGRNTANFTAINELFIENPQIDLWRFEVVYSFPNETSKSALNFATNHPPTNGSCSITPLTGNTSTLFTVSCPDWVDEDGIKDYSLYVWTDDPAQQSIIAFSPVSDFQIRLPTGNDPIFLLNIVVYIRDLLDCRVAVNINAVTVIPDLLVLNDLMSNVQKQSQQLNKNPIIALLASGNQNIVGQVIASVSQQFNKMNSETLLIAATSGIPLADISVASLGSASYQQTIGTFNTTAFTEYNNALNAQAAVRDYIMTYINKLAITTSNSIILQSSALTQLTQATNQLTRSSSLIASDRCHQLSVALHSMATKTAYEQTLAASNQLIQCAANALTAINGPIQERMAVLDLDRSRVNSLPLDYDTDLESAWSNPNLFADGNDFSQATVEKNRNIYYQKQAADQIQTQVDQIVSLITASLNIHINLGQHIAINTSDSFMSLETISVESLANRITRQVENAAFYLPSNFTLNTTSNSSISLRSMMNPLPVFGNSKSTLNQNVSRSISLTILEPNGNEIAIQTNNNESIRLIIPRDPNLIIPPMILQNVTDDNNILHNHTFYLKYINITTSSLSISIHFEIHPLDNTLAYLFIYKFDQVPVLNSTTYLIDQWHLFCPFDLTSDGLYKYFIDNQKTSGHRSLVFGFRELTSVEITSMCSQSTPASPPMSDERYNFTSNYELRIYTSGCFYLDANGTWKADGLIVGSSTNHHETECLSTHLTTFAGGLIILPSPINWSYVFANADFMRNKTIYLTIILISAVYVILMIYSRFQDKKDIEKLGVTPMLDNAEFDQCFYEILVFTGRRWGSGTSSKVQFILSGANGETNVRTLSDSKRKILQRGEIDAFLMAVPQSLGLLNYIRIWHDNSGRGSSASWFLKYIIVRDLQTMENFYFISQKWFAVENNDQSIERLIPVASEIEKHKLSYILSKKVYYNLSDSHLWLSIFSRPPSVNFSRAQRCTCCFVLLFTSMLLNIMYYDLSKEAKSSNVTDMNGFSIGPLYISLQQIIIGVIVELSSLVPSLLIIQFFKRIRSRQQMSPVDRTLRNMKSSLQFKVPNNGTSKKRTGIRITFPWWCAIIAYILSLLIIAMSIFFIIARGIEFGDLKTQKWLTSVLSGLFSSIFLTQPIKAISLTVFFACFFRNDNEDKEAKEYITDYSIGLNDDEDYLYSTENHSQYREKARRLNERELDSARRYRLKEIEMWSLIREAFTFSIYLALIILITYFDRESNSFLQVQHLRKYFINSREIDLDYSQIQTIDDYWQWLENSFVSNLRAQQWYNGDPPRYLSGFINDKSNRLIGWATMRQLRVKPSFCSDQRIISTCNDDYSLFNEEKHSFQPGWINQTSTSTEYSSSIFKAFQYQSSELLDTSMYVGEHGIYGGGGYVYELRGRLTDIINNVSKLHQSGWIDGYTRAVFIQMTLYNPNIAMFTAVTFVTEFLSTASITPTVRFDPINFYVFTSLLQLICSILYVGFIIYLVISECRLLFRLKLKYFRRFRSYIEFGIIFCSFGCIALYIWQFRESKHISRKFHDTNGYIQINIQFLVYVNNLLTILKAFCCFFGTIKFVYLFRCQRRISIMIDTLHYVRKDLVSFSTMFTIVFMSFISLFYLLFVSKMSTCSNLLSTAQMLFEMTLMKFDANELIDAEPTLGPLCFCLFIFLAVFVCLSMFISIIIDAFRLARNNQNNEDDMLSFIFEKFLNMLGIQRSQKSQVNEQEILQKQSQLTHPIESLPDRVDLLLVKLTRFYMNQKHEISQLKSSSGKQSQPRILN